MTTQLQRLAAEVRSKFKLKTRDNGAEFWARESNEDDWIQSLCFEAHGDMLPEDWRYRFIVEALDALSEFDDPDEARDSLEASIYNHELTDWLGSHGHRPGYVDEACEEFGFHGGTIERIQWGMLSEKWEVFDSVLASIEEQLEGDNDE